jgi:hypothetical protein
MFHLKCNPTTHEIQAENDETCGSSEFLQPYPVAADALIETGKAVFKFFLLDKQLSQTDTSFVPKCCYQSVYCTHFGTSISAHTLLNAVRRAANDVDAKYCSRIDIYSTREYTMFVLTQHFGSHCEQRPSNRGDLDVSMTGELGTVCYRGCVAFDIVFV